MWIIFCILGAPFKRAANSACPAALITQSSNARYPLIWVLRNDSSASLGDPKNPLDLGASKLLVYEREPGVKRPPLKEDSEWLITHGSNFLLADMARFPL